MVSLNIEPQSIMIEEAEAAKYSKILESQLTVQTVRMTNSMSRNDEISTVCVTDSGEIGVCKIEADGDCLFSAISHQLKSEKIGSDAHKSNTSVLRNDCVGFMKNNLPKYERDIRQRIQEKFPEQKNIEFEDCGKFLDHCLSKRSNWCGSECLKVLSDMLSINILIFNEKGCSYFFQQFRPEFDRTIMIAFRIADRSNEDISNANRNHYDSVVKVQANIIAELVHTSTTNFLKLNAMKGTDFVTISD